VRGDQVVGSHGNAVHQWVTISRGPNSRVRSSTGADDVPVNAILGGALLSCGKVSGITGLLQAVKEWPVGRNRVI
jgi:hypothetical protein